MRLVDILETTCSVSRLSETLDTTIKTTVIKTDDRWTFRFSINGLDYQMDIDCDDADEQIYSVRFSATDDKDYTPNGRVGHGAIKVLATVFNLICDFITEVEPNFVDCCGETGTQQSIYARIIPQILRKRGLSRLYAVNGRNMIYRK